MPKPLACVYMFLTGNFSFFPDIAVVIFDSDWNPMMDLQAQGEL